MINPFHIGDEKEFCVTVGESDVAQFELGTVHPFYATFALGRDAEWAGRLFVLEMKEEDEEGIGTYLTIEHKSPAMLNDEVRIISKIEQVNGNSVHCSFKALIGDRLIAEGTTGQKILKKSRLEELKLQING